MSDQLIAQVRDALEMPIDFEGQKKAELMSTVVLVVTGMLALITGYILQSIHITLFVGLGGTLFSFFIAVPPWPIFTEDPERWLDPLTKGAPVMVESKKVI